MAQLLHAKQKARVFYMNPVIFDTESLQASGQKNKKVSRSFVVGLKKFMLVPSVPATIHRKTSMSIE